MIHKTSLAALNKPLIFLTVLFLPYLAFHLNLKLSSTPSSAPIALVFGAGILPNHQPSLVLQSRLDTALKLYQQQQIKAILVSGDNRVEDYNEPDVMGDYLLAKGVPATSVIRDYGGRRTIDSCWRAKNVFRANQIYIVTQVFHLPRAFFLCQKEGLVSIPSAAIMPTDNIRKFYQEAREVLASWRSVFELYHYQPPIKSNGQEPDLSQFN